MISIHPTDTSAAARPKPARVTDLVHSGDLHEVGSAVCEYTCKTVRKQIGDLTVGKLFTA